MAKLESDLNRRYTIMKYETTTGRQKTAMMKEEHLQQWLECFTEQKPFFIEVEGVMKGFHPKEIVDFEFVVPQGAFDHVDELSKQFGKVLPLWKNKAESAPVVVQEVTAEKKEVAADQTDALDEAMRATAGYEIVPRITFKVECKCGATYPAPLRRDTRRCSCKFCKETVFVDYSEGLKDTKFGRGYLLTNKKFVPRDQQVPSELYELQEV